MNQKALSCLLTGAAGDALGYTVEFMTRRQILATYGPQGITAFQLHSGGKAIISDDTQMTLFTAAGLRLNTTGTPLEHIREAYLDWYFTQTHAAERTHCATALARVDALHRLRAPGNTCLSALRQTLLGRPVDNNSCGCGGIMRVAPVALYGAAHGWSDKEVGELAGEAARLTHRHPLGFLPAAMQAIMVRKTLLDDKDPYTTAQETVDALQDIYKGEHTQGKARLATLSQAAISMAHSDTPAHDAIRQLGEGWVGDEAWAIALFCVLRFPNDPVACLRAAVNHDGDSDSTGAIAGNIIGARCDCKALDALCPGELTLKDTLELYSVIETLATTQETKNASPDSV